MALNINIVSDIGQTFENAYIRIDEHSVDKNDTIYARIRGYVSRELMTEGKSFISGSEDIIKFTGNFSDTAVNTKKQIYEYMKTLEKYSVATDVLE